jgi:hypothetical protein
MAFVSVCYQLTQLLNLVYSEIYLDHLLHVQVVCRDMSSQLQLGNTILYSVSGLAYAHPTLLYAHPCAPQHQI